MYTVGAMGRLTVCTQWWYTAVRKTRESMHKQQVTFTLCWHVWRRYVQYSQRFASHPQHSYETIQGSDFTRHHGTMKYSQTLLMWFSFIRIPRHLEENHWLQIYTICHAYIQVCVFDYPVLSPIRIFFCGKQMCAVKRGLTVA